MRKLLIALLVMNACAVVEPCWGLGRSGHRIVGAIASSYLTDEARAATIDLLDNETMADVSTWADEIRSDRQYAWARPLHFINVPRHATSVDLSRNCQDDECVVAAINHFADVLRDTTASKHDRIEALKFLVHFVGDVHQPLHVSYADDRGGNAVDARFFGESTNLHRIWDTKMIERRADGDWVSLAIQIARSIEDEDRVGWQSSPNPVEWANESLETTRSIYTFFEDDLAAGNALHYGHEEYAEDIEIIERRLAVAGVRLAALLNDIFAPDQVTFADVPEPEATPEPQTLTICSFNIQFLGNSRSRDDAALASILQDYDLVVVQELVSPPFDGTFPGGTPFKPDAESAEFFDEMVALGFDFVISEEDTGTGDTIHRNGSATEWWVTFHKPESVSIATDLPSGFLAADRSNHPDYERVPYAFGFRTADSSMDFVLVSVHLQPGSSSSDAARRKHELSSIATWIGQNDDVERDFIILGDMNIEDEEELLDATPAGFGSLNDECRPTNTNVNGPKPYDHVIVNPLFTTEVDGTFDFVVVDLIEAMRAAWAASSTDPYPGDPYNHNQFRKFYSDHHPVVFKLELPAEDDD